MKTREITALGLLIAIEILLAIVPNIGMIMIGPVSITIMHIPVIIAALMMGVKGGLILGLVFGASSWFVAATRGVTPIDLLFVNPIVAILPRLIFGSFCGLMSLLLKNKNDILRSGLTAVLGTLVHSVIVLSVIFFLGVLTETNGVLSIVSQLWVFIAGIMASNGILEAVAAGVIVIPVVKIVNKIYVK
ncbi:MAG: ECF transporter S component [Erysipelotrichaceae bacterium]